MGYTQFQPSADVRVLARAESACEKKKAGLKRGEKLATMTVELNLERMERMKQEVFQAIEKMVIEYGNVSVLELEMALIEGLAKVREMGMKKTEEKDENVV